MYNKLFALAEKWIGRKQKGTIFIENDRTLQYFTAEANTKLILSVYRTFLDMKMHFVLSSWGIIAV